MWGYEHGAGLMGIGMLLWVIPVALLIWLFTRIALDRGGKEGSSRSARELLDTRYARGEIGRDEYLERRAELDRQP